MNTFLPRNTPRHLKVSSPPCKTQGSSFPLKGRNRFKLIRKFLNLFKSKPNVLYIHNDPLIKQSKELRDKIFAHRFPNVF